MTSAKSSQTQANTGLSAAQEPPPGWTPEADTDRQWQTLADFLRQDDEPEMPAHPMIVAGHDVFLDLSWLNRLAESGRPAPRRCVHASNPL